MNLQQTNVVSRHGRLDLLRNHFSLDGDAGRTWKDGQTEKVEGRTKTTKVQAPIGETREKQSLLHS